MVVITVQNYRKENVQIITTTDKELFWVRMIDVQKRLCIQNMSHLVRREIQGKFET